jgi:hypothetical protein
MLWCGEFAAAVGEAPSVDAGSWVGTRFADKPFSFRETPDGTPVSMAGVTSMVVGQIRVDPVHTPKRLGLVVTGCRGVADQEYGREEVPIDTGEDTHRGDRRR